MRAPSRLLAVLAASSFLSTAMGAPFDVSNATCAANVTTVLVTVTPTVDVVPITTIETIVSSIISTETVAATTVTVTADGTPGVCSSSDSGFWTAAPVPGTIPHVPVFSSPCTDSTSPTLPLPVSETPGGPIIETFSLPTGSIPVVELTRTIPDSAISFPTSEPTERTTFLGPPALISRSMITASYTLILTVSSIEPPATQTPALEESLPFHGPPTLGIPGYASSSPSTEEVVGTPTNPVDATSDFVVPPVITKVTSQLPPVVITYTLESLTPSAPPRVLTFTLEGIPPAVEITPVSPPQGIPTPPADSLPAGYGGQHSESVVFTVAEGSTLSDVSPIPTIPTPLPDAFSIPGSESTITTQVVPLPSELPKSEVPWLSTDAFSIFGAPSVSDLTLTYTIPGVAGIPASVITFTTAITVGTAEESLSAAPVIPEVTEPSVTYTLPGGYGHGSNVPTLPVYTPIGSSPPIPVVPAPPELTPSIVTVTETTGQPTEITLWPWTTGSTTPREEPTEITLWPWTTGLTTPPEQPTEITLLPWNTVSTPSEESWLWSIEGGVPSDQISAHSLPQPSFISPGDVTSPSIAIITLPPLPVPTASSKGSTPPGLSGPSLIDTTSEESTSCSEEESLARPFPSTLARSLPLITLTRGVPSPPSSFSTLPRASIISSLPDIPTPESSGSFTSSNTDSPASSTTDSSAPISSSGPSVSIGWPSSFSVGGYQFTVPTFTSEQSLLPTTIEFTIPGYGTHTPGSTSLHGTSMGVGLPSSSASLLKTSSSPASPSEVITPSSTAVPPSSTANSSVVFSSSFSSLPTSTGVSSYFPLANVSSSLPWNGTLTSAPASITSAPIGTGTLSGGTASNSTALSAGAPLFSSFWNASGTAAPTPTQFPNTTLASPISNSTSGTSVFSFSTALPPIISTALPPIISSALPPIISSALPPIMSSSQGFNASLSFNLSSASSTLASAAPTFTPAGSATLASSTAFNSSVLTPVPSLLRNSSSAVAGNATSAGLPSQGQPLPTPTAGGLNISSILPLQTASASSINLNGTTFSLAGPIQTQSGAGVSPNISAITSIQSAGEPVPTQNNTSLPPSGQASLAPNSTANATATPPFTTFPPLVSSSQPGLGPLPSNASVSTVISINQTGLLPPVPTSGLPNQTQAAPSGNISITHLSQPVFSTLSTDLGNTTTSTIANWTGTLSSITSTPATPSIPVQSGPGPISSASPEAPVQSVPGQTVPGQSVPSETAPVQTVPGQSVAGETGPVQTVPGQTVPGQSVPGQSVPGEPSVTSASLNQTSSGTLVGPSPISTAPPPAGQPTFGPEATSAAEALSASATSAPASNVSPSSTGVESGPGQQTGFGPEPTSSSLPGTPSMSGIWPPPSSSTSGPPLPSSTCGNPADLGNFTLNFDDLPIQGVGNDTASNSIDPVPMFSPYHRFWFSSGFGFLPPPTSKYEPSSPKLMLQWTQGITANGSVGDDTAEIGVGTQKADSCMRFNFLGANLGCNSTGPSCLFNITGLRSVGDGISPDVKVVTNIWNLTACAAPSNCSLVPIVAKPDDYFNLTSIKIQLTVGNLTGATWWGDDLLLGWTNNTCEAGKCRSNVRNSVFGRRDRMKSTGFWRRLVEAF